MARLGAEVRRMSALAVLSAVAAVGLALILSGTVRAAAVGAAAAVAVVLAVVAFRARAASRAARAGCRKVYAVGWIRSPDGANFALFAPEADPASDEPEAVVRLPMRRATKSGRAILCGKLEPSLWGAVALFSESGDVLGFGRVGSARSAAKVWSRRHAPTPWWVAGGGMNRPPAH
jgi:hypothetical protein